MCPATPASRPLRAISQYAAASLTFRRRASGVSAAFRARCLESSSGAVAVWRIRVGSVCNMLVLLVRALGPKTVPGTRPGLAHAVAAAPAVPGGDGVTGQDMS